MLKGELVKILNYSFFTSILLLVPTISYSQSQYCTRTSINAHTNLGEQLLAVAKANTPKKLRALLSQVAQQYRGNSRGFFEIMNTRDDDGFNIIQLAATTGDLENMDSILNTIERFYGSDIQGIYDYLITRDKRGVSLLGLAEYLGNRRIVEQILIRAMNRIGHSKEMFFTFLNIGSYKNDWKPLSDAAYDNESETVEMMVKLGAYVLGRHSKYFKEFINATDIDGLNALRYADNPRVKFLLLDYGAVQPQKKLNPLLPLVNKYGLELNDASNQGNFSIFKQALKHANDYQADPNLLFYFFSARNGAGWNPFINTAADGQYKYIKLMLETMDKLFPKDAQEDKTQLLSNTDFEGRTPLHLAILRRHFKVARLIIDNTVRYSVNKPYLFNILNCPDELNGFTPFINAVYGAEEFDKEMYDFIKYFIEKMIDLFGRDSRMFYLILNTREYNNWTVLSYVSDPKLIKLLKSYGAIDTPMKHFKGIGEFEKLAMRGIV